MASFADTIRPWQEHLIKSFLETKGLMEGLSSSEISRRFSVPMRGKSEFSRNVVWVGADGGVRQYDIQTMTVSRKPDIVIIDDPHDIDEAFVTEAKRRALDYWTEAVNHTLFGDIKPVEIIASAPVEFVPRRVPTVSSIFSLNVP